MPRYHIEVNCDSTVLEVTTVNSQMDAVALLAAYLVRGASLVERQSAQYRIAKELPVAIEARGFACFECGAVTATVEPCN
jgi:hypothetical protein